MLPTELIDPRILSNSHSYIMHPLFFHTEDDQWCTISVRPVWIARSKTEGKLHQSDATLSAFPVRHVLQQGAHITVISYICGACSHQSYVKQMGGKCVLWYFLEMLTWPFILVFFRVIFFFFFYCLILHQNESTGRVVHMSCSRYCRNNAMKMAWRAR